MKRFVCIVLAGAFVSLTAPCAEEAEAAGEVSLDEVPSGDTLLARVRIISGESVAVWDASGITVIDGNAEPETSFAAITSFFAIEPGSALTAGELEKECRLAELRMGASGLFYEATCALAPVRKNPEERTVIITVSPGFLWRFNGGDLWAMVGKAGLGGGRGSIVAWFGWNRNGIRWFNPRVLGTRAAIGVESVLMGPGDSAVRPTDEPLVRSALTAGYSFSPDAHSGLELMSMTTLGSDGNEEAGFPSIGLFSAGPYLSWKRFLPVLHDDPAALTSGHAVIRAMNVEGAWQAEAWSATRIPLAGRFACSFKVAAGAGSNEVPIGALFDLYDYDDRCVRSGYEEDQLTASSFALASTELRFTALSARIIPIVPMDVVPFLFCDAAALSAPNELGSNVLRDAYAFGIGTRVLFDNPVFAYFSFSYGINPDGDGRFMFCGTAGY
ncbi:MAG TPA: hypothetical protein PLU93_10810 [Treponemataceae bacterium]|jgi:hypothetical protein|nr:hypothetical protein [Treponemataceae bacterium]